MKFQLLALSNEDKMKKISILILLFLTVAISAQAKRSAPKKVIPVEHEGMMYVVLHWGYENGTGQNGGYIEARDKKTQEKIWGLQVYKIEYRPELESDVQDIFITDIQIDKIKQILSVKNEESNVYHVDIKKRKVVYVSKR
ncbi:hypothetical protein VU04_11425 [Desulfobulbus sp. TB]|nr:hypothetical protein [Desulfobulbus sp. TB]